MLCSFESEFGEKTTVGIFISHLPNSVHFSFLLQSKCELVEQAVKMVGRHITPTPKSFPQMGMMSVPVMSG